MQHNHAEEQKQGFKQSFEGLPAATDANAGLSAFNSAWRGEPNCQELLDSRRSRSLTFPHLEKAGEGITLLHRLVRLSEVSQPQ